VISLIFLRRSCPQLSVRSKPVAHHPVVPVEDLEIDREETDPEAEEVVLVVSLVVMMIRKPVELPENSSHLSVAVADMVENQEDMVVTGHLMKVVEVDLVVAVEVVTSAAAVTGETEAAAAARGEREASEEAVVVLEARGERVVEVVLVVRGGKVVEVVLVVAVLVVEEVVLLVLLPSRPTFPKLNQKLNFLYTNQPNQFMHHTGVIL